jgi:D-threonate/D-erythronate kinase
LNDSSNLLVGIFADDLTGALDAAAPFAASGFRTVVSSNSELPHGAESAEVVSINLGTRHMDPTAIKDHVEQGVGALADLGARVMLNKVDSTLRGNPGVELAIALRKLSADHAVLCPAYPQNGRTVEDGILLVNGVPVVDTDIGQDRLSPLPSSGVENIVLSSLDRANLSLQLHLFGNDGGRAVSDLLPVIIAADARTDSDLQMLAERVVRAESRAFVAGSAGVSIALADVLRNSRKTLRPQTGTISTGRRILIVTASQRSIVDEQFKALGDEIDSIHAELTVDEAIEGVSAESIGRMTEVVSRDGVVVLQVGKPDAGEKLSTNELRSAAEEINRNLGEFVRAITDSSTPDVLVVIGGDTTAGVLTACGVTSLELQGELQPGTVSAVPGDGSIAGGFLITRAGGFGDKTSLLELVSLLQFGHGV